MFERFTPEARAVVVGAQNEARALRHEYLGTEHLLLGVAGQSTGVAAEVLHAAGVTYAGLREGVVRTVGMGSTSPVLSGDDGAYLATLGIDLDAVRARVEELFGPGALDVPVFPARFRGRRRRWGRRRATCARQPAGPHLPFTPRAKKVLELSLREALTLRHDWIGPEHVLLGIIREGEGLAALLLSESGADLQQLRQQILDRLRYVA